MNGVGNWTLLNQSKKGNQKLAINVIHQRLYLFQLNASTEDTKTTRECLAKGINVLKPAALGGEEVIVLKITPQENVITKTAMRAIAFQFKGQK